MKDLEGVLGTCGGVSGTKLVATGDADGLRREVAERVKVKGKSVVSVRPLERRVERVEQGHVCGCPRGHQSDLLVTPGNRGRWSQSPWNLSYATAPSVPSTHRVLHADV